MKKSLATLALIGSLALVLSGCTNGSFGLLGPGEEPSVSATDSETPEFAQPFDADDVMFAQMMIVHHEQAVEMSAFAQTNTENPKVLALASAISSTQESEIITMKSWLTAAGAADSHMHDMMMPGLADQMTIEQLATSTGMSFDSLFLMTMIAHHEGAIVMADTVLATTSNDDVVALAQNVIETQRAEIAEMYTLLGP